VAKDVLAKRGDRKEPENTLDAIIGRKKCVQGRMEKLQLRSTCVSANKEYANMRGDKQKGADKKRGA